MFQMKTLNIGKNDNYMLIITDDLILKISIHFSFISTTYASQSESSVVHVDVQPSFGVHVANGIRYP